MLQICLWLQAIGGEAYGGVLRIVSRALARDRVREENGQTTAEYALVILAAAAIAVVLIVWARSSGKLPAFFDKIIDSITNDAK